MGFYNIYKILKDMLRTLFGKRFLKITIIVILIFIIFFVYNECFALSTIPPITVDGVTFTFNDSRWSEDYPSFRGNMDNITIFRVERTNGQYLYAFTRSSYPIDISIYKSGNYTICQTHSYKENGENSYYIYNYLSVSKSTTVIDTSSPSYRWRCIYYKSI